MKAPIRIFLLVAFVVLGACAVSAQQKQKMMSKSSFAAAYRSDLLAHWKEFTEKIVSLAEATPEEKYSWRPGPGVRSVGEVYTHIANSGYFFMKMAGIESPAGVDMDMIDSLKEKAKIVAALKQSCEYVAKSIMNTTDADFDKPAKIFGRDGTVREVFFLCATHLPEHLGQSIAYARMNDVVPPWTAARQAKQQQPGKK